MGGTLGAKQTTAPRAQGLQGGPCCRLMEARCAVSKKQALYKYLQGFRALQGHGHRCPRKGEQPGKAGAAAP